MSNTKVPGSGNFLGNNCTHVTGRRSMRDQMVALGLSPTGSVSRAKDLSTGSSRIKTLPSFISPEDPLSIGTNVARITCRNKVMSTTIPPTHTSFIRKYNGALNQENGFFMRRDTDLAGLGNGSMIEFKFKADNFFANNNKAHIVVGGRGRAIDMNRQGKGIIIGNSTEYHAHSGVCKPTSFQHDFAIVSFWEDGNCVFGSGNTPSNLRDRVVYSVVIWINAVSKRIAYSIKGEDGYRNTHNVLDPFFDRSGQNLSTQSEMFILAVPDSSTRTWYIDFGDVAYYNCQ